MSFFPFSRFIVSGKSMYPNLKPRESVITLNWFIDLKPGDLVVVKINNKLMIKRIKSVKGKRLYLIGDNKKESTDSRHFGKVDKDSVVGKVVLTL